NAFAAPPQIQEDRVTAPKGATLDLQVAPMPAEKLRVLTRDGTALQPVPNAVRTGTGVASKVSIPQGKAVVIRNESAPSSAPKPLTSKETPVDAVLVESVPVAGTGTVQDIRQWTLTIYAAQMPLAWNPEKHAYTTELLVRLKELGQAQGSNPSSPITVQLVGKGVTLEPQTLELSKAGIGGIQRALVSLRNHRSKGTVEAISDFGEQSYEVGAGAQLAQLVLSPTLTAIPGFGIGTTWLSAVLRAEDGLEFSTASPLAVTLTATGGRLASPALVIPANATRSQPVELRSSWLGQAEIRASVDGIEAKPLGVHFSTPWSYLVAILLGAGVGSYVRVRPRLRSHKSEFFAGVGVGLILGLGSFLGISSVGGLPTTAIVTELGCLVVAAIEAYLGRAALDRFGANGTPPVPNPKPV
ncbi:MAG TPA: hypothetical protein VIM73_01650, partial [Polyangiaceae bacterium]